MATTKKVTSSFITATTWQTTGKDHKGMPVGEVTVHMVGGRQYTYRFVSLWIYGAMHMPGTSVGRYYNQAIKGCFERKAEEVVVDLTAQLRKSLAKAA